MPVLFFAHAMVAVVLIAMLTAGTLLDNNRRGAASGVAGGAAPRPGATATDDTATSLAGQSTGTDGPAGTATSDAASDSGTTSLAGPSGTVDGATSTRVPVRPPPPGGGTTGGGTTGGGTTGGTTGGRTGGGCLRVTHQLNTQWPGGLQAQFTVANCGSATINGWLVTVSFSDAVAIQVWSATADNGSPTVRFNPVPYDSSIEPGRSVTFGFNATWSAGPARSITGCAVASGSCS